MANKGGQYTGGRGGIRTHGTLAGTPVFKTGALNHSATLPLQRHQALRGGRSRTVCEQVVLGQSRGQSWERSSKPAANLSIASAGLASGPRSVSAWRRSGDRPPGHRRCARGALKTDKPSWREYISERGAEPVEQDQNRSRNVGYGARVDVRTATTCAQWF